MKKKVKKLRLSRETLRGLEGSDARKVAAGDAGQPYSPQTGGGGGPCCTILEPPSEQVVC